MEVNSENYDCTYVFSADQQNEVRKILEKYLPHNEDKMEQLRKLDRSVTIPGSVFSLLLGICGILLHGIGIRYYLTGEGPLFAAGVTAIILGLLAVFSAYPVYRIVTKKRREKTAPEIIRLCQELLK